MSSNRSDIIKMGKYIAKLRKEKGYTQKALGDLLDVSDKTVSKWELGDIAPDITILSSLAEELDSSVEAILNGEEVSKEDSKEEIPIKMMEVYTEQSKKTTIKRFTIGFIIIFSTLLIGLFLDHYYQWHVTKISSDGDFKVRRYLISNNKESKLIINSLFYEKKKDGSDDDYYYKIDSYYLKIYAKDKLIYEENIKFDTPTSMDKIFDKSYLMIDNLPKLKNDDIVISVIILYNNIDEPFIISF